MLLSSVFKDQLLTTAQESDVSNALTEEDIRPTGDTSGVETGRTMLMKLDISAE